MTDLHLPSSSRFYTEKVDPVNRKETRGTVYVDEYVYDRIILGFSPGDVFVDSAKHKLRESKRGSDRLYYRYPDKPPVMITTSGVFKHKSYSTDDSEEQAYFTLSQMESAGYVTGWSKK